MTNLTTLSRRVSEADGPSRELDGDVFEAVENVPCDRHVGPFLIGPNAIWGDAHGPRPVPRYTASLDAVAALIAEKLPRFKWSLHKSGSPYVAGVTKEAPIRTMPHMGVAKTPALALLSAALLAIHERNKSDE